MTDRMTDLDSRLSRLDPIPHPASPPGQLAQALRDLARAAGFENLRQLRERAHVGLGVVSEALSGKPDPANGKIRVPTKQVVDALCAACNADQPRRAHLQDLRDKACEFKRQQESPEINDPPPPDHSPDGAKDPPVSGSPAEPVEHDVTDPADDISQQTPRGRRWWWWWWWWLLIAACVVVLVTAGVVVWRWWPNGCGSGMQLNNSTDNECIGLTDGSYLFNDPAKATSPGDRSMIEGMNYVEGQIKKENSAVAGADNYEAYSGQCYRSCKTHPELQRSAVDQDR